VVTKVLDVQAAAGSGQSALDETIQPWDACVACETSAEEGVCWGSPRRPRDVALFTFFKDPQLNTLGAHLRIPGSAVWQPRRPSYRQCRPINWPIKAFGI
jgi:hypothetical protein